ncbi:DUF2975 domain-containing protein [Winogradskyella sp. SYSU M77433]|uniref:DUF2975 domain-containing protein n=1 Tax=Winogradskyella sp. SYSU M77433 TaxID=3042722 RepID=UPI00247FF530|nr:DUF2975 domain-containing protein [Winogradskyella sp. SYSU M77433]MDH7912257.1 DUF2975 domain-containing protein [Winogradskyella sp. SYSU M77433]
MNFKSVLIHPLYWFFNISFYFLILWLIVSFASDIFTDDGKFGRFSSGNHHNIGYQLPVKFSISPKEPLYNNELYKLEKEVYNKSGYKYSVGKSEYLKAINSKDSINHKSIVSIHNNSTIDYYNLTSTSFVSDGYITVDPKTLSNKIVIIFRSYLGFLLLIIVFFFLKKIFKLLIENFKFSQRLYKNVNIVGLLLIGHTLLKSLANFYLGKNFQYASIKPIKNNINYVAISMNPRLDFEFTLFLLGCVLLILSTLLYKGSQIQEENELTI